MYLEPPRLNEIYNLIHSLKINKSPGPDNIDAYWNRLGLMKYIISFTPSKLTNHLGMITLMLTLFELVAT